MKSVESLNKVSVEGYGEKKISPEFAALLVLCSTFEKEINEEKKKENMWNRFLASSLVRFFMPKRNMLSKLKETMAIIDSQLEEKRKFHSEYENSYYRDRLLMKAGSNNLFIANKGSVQVNLFKEIPELFEKIWTKEESLVIEQPCSSTSEKNFFEKSGGRTLVALFLIVVLSNLYTFWQKSDSDKTKKEMLDKDKDELEFDAE